MVDLKKLSELDTYKRTGQRIKQGAGKALRALPFIIAVAWLGVNLLMVIAGTVMEIAGVIPYMPGYLKVEGFLVAAVITAVEAITHTAKRELGKAEKYHEKKLKEVTINNNNWQQHFKAKMSNSIQLFREENQLTPREEEKFRRIVNYAIRDMEKELMKL